MAVVGAVPVGEALKPTQDAKRLAIALEAAVATHDIVERYLASVAEWRMD
jgi:hypothetical protein